MSMTLEEAIIHAEEVVDRCEVTDGDRACAAEHRQLAEWLKELQERRKQPEIVYCKDCKHYKIDHPKANGYHCCYRCHNIFPMKETDFCSRAERRTDADD